MLMSLTMRLRSKCPPVFWRATSVVAIPTPSFGSSSTVQFRSFKIIGRCDPPEFILSRTDNYTAAKAFPARQIACPEADMNLFRNVKKTTRDSLFDLEELRDVAEFGVSRRHQFRGGHLLKFGEMFLQGDIQKIRGSFVIAMSSALGFRNNAVDAAKFTEVGRGDAHGFGGEFLF